MENPNVNVIEKATREHIANIVANLLKVAKKMLELELIEEGSVFIPNTYKWFKYKLPLTLQLETEAEQVIACKRWTQIIKGILTEKGIEV